MWERCRYCGSIEGRLQVLEEGERACPACAGSPLCDRCGHRRASHSGVFAPSGRKCKHVWEDLPTGTRLPCACDGFAPIKTAIGDAAFLDRELTDDLPPLRVAPRR